MTVDRRSAIKRLGSIACSALAGCGGGAALELPAGGRVNGDGVLLSALAGTPHWAAASHGKLGREAIVARLATVFDTSTVQRLDIEIEAVNWQRMQADLAALMARRAAGASFAALPDPLNVPARVRHRGIDWYKVGVRFKGSSSLYNAGTGKLPFKLRFDEFEDDYPAIDGQRFHGFKTLHLKNNFHDDAQLHERLADDLLREFGIAGPHASHVRLYVDRGDGAGPRYFGLYTLVEDIEDTVLKTQFADDEGNLYKPEEDAARFAAGTFDTDELDLKTNEDGATFADVRSLHDAINDSALQTSDRAAWRSAVEAVFDMPRFLKWLAANTVMQNWDSYGAMPHNYYLYADAGNRGRLAWVPWDHNEALAENPLALPLALTGVASSWPLVHHVARDSVWFSSYRTQVGSFASEHFNSERLDARVLSLAASIRDAALAELAGYTMTSASRFDSAVAVLRAHIDSRHRAALAFAAA